MRNKRVYIRMTEKEVEELRELSGGDVSGYVRGVLFGKGGVVKLEKEVEEKEEEVTEEALQVALPVQCQGSPFCKEPAKACMVRDNVVWLCEGHGK